MPLRLVEVVLPPEAARQVPELLREAEVAPSELGIWTETLEGQRSLVRVLVEQGEEEAVIDLLETRYGGEEVFRLLILAVEATLPRVEPPQPEDDREEAPSEDGEEAEESRMRLRRVSREELHSKLTDMGDLTPEYLTLTALATVVAAIGLVFDNPAVVIGSMVIAPLLGPVVALSLATTLGDGDLARRSLLANTAGLAVSFLIALLAGTVLGAIVVDPAALPSIGEIQLRTDPTLGDVILGLSVGVAGVLAFTSGVSTALVGVMVAVALLPPLVTAGLLAGAGHGSLAVQALLLTTVYVVTINLAAVGTFAFQGVRPNRWWEADRAKRATRTAVALWAVLLVVLVVLLVYLDLLPS